MGNNHVKKENGMKKSINTIIILITIVFTMTVLSACQPTPENEIVVNKNTQPNQDNSLNTAMPPYSVPEQWTDTYEYYDGKVVVNVDADIIVPQTETFNTYSLIPATFTQAQAEKLVNVLFGDAELEAPEQQWTKAQYEELLINFKLTYSQGNNPNMSEAEYEANVRDLEAKIVAAPETAVVLNPAEQIQAFSESGALNLQADLGRKEKARLTIRNLDEGYLSSVRFNNNDGDDYEAISLDDAGVKLKLSKEEAQTQAEDLLSKLGIDYMKPAAVKVGAPYALEGESTENLPQCYLVYFTRTIEGVPATYDDATGATSDSDDYDKLWAYERIIVGVDDGGIVQFQWEGNASTPEITQSNVALLDFEKVMDIFKENMGIQYAYTDDPSILSDTYQISKITLGLTRIKVKGGYQLVPVWDFFGMVQTATADGEIRDTIRDGSGGSNTIDSFLTINAMDGSVIDRSVGY